MESTRTLPSKPAKQYVKPTLANTDGGKTYKPSHPGLFTLEFGEPSRVENGTSGSDERYSSKLVTVKVRLDADPSPSELTQTFNRIFRHIPSFARLRT